MRSAEQDTTTMREKVGKELGEMDLPNADTTPPQETHILGLESSKEFLESLGNFAEATANEAVGKEGGVTANTRVARRNPLTILKEKGKRLFKRKEDALKKAA